MAEPAAGGLERHLRDPAPVDADRRQGPPRADALDEPRVACDAVCDAPAGSRRRRSHTAPARSRSTSTSSSIGCACRRPTAAAAAFALEPHAGRDVLHALLEELDRLELHVADPRDAERDRRSDPVRSGRGASRLRSGVRRAVLARRSCRPTGCSSCSAPASSASAARCTSSGALPTSPSPASPAAAPAAPRRRAEPARRGDARGLLARGQQRRLLAGRRRRPVPGLLLLRVSRAGRLLRRARQAGRRVLQCRLRRVRPAVRRRPASRVARRHAARFLQSTYEAAADLAGWDRAARSAAPIRRAPEPERRSGYSVRSATMGSTLAARRAGIQAARDATVTSTAAAAV